MTSVAQANDAGSIAVVHELFREYQEALGIDLGFQDFDHELATLPGAYAPPRGRLLLAHLDGRAAGCIALRPLSDEICEMKRLYVRPDARAAGLGRQLAERLIVEARSIGYRKMCLDTLSTMTAARRLYEALGFTEIPAYCHNPITGAQFLGLEL